MLLLVRARLGEMVDYVGRNRGQIPIKNFKQFQPPEFVTTLIQRQRSAMGQALKLGQVLPLAWHNRFKGRYLPIGIKFNPIAPCTCCPTEILAQ